MPVKFILRKKEYKVRSGMTLRDALLKLEIQPETVIAVDQGDLITDDEILRDGQVIRLVSVISGGKSI